MIVPSTLKHGDTIGVIAPSSPFEAGRLGPGLEYLRRRGYRVREGASLHARERYLAGTDGERAADLIAMFADPEVRAVCVARGGYGSVRILEALDEDRIRRDPKILVGFSDTTALQLGIYARTGLVSFSGVTLCADVTEQGMAPDTEHALWEALEEGHHPAVEGLRTLKGSGAEGTLIGGCLCLVASLVGTPYFPDPTGALIFLEDVHEEPYRVDRMLTQLRLAGVFNRAAGLLLGEFQGCDPEREEDGPVEAVFEDLAQTLACPVFAGLPYGHGPGRCVLPIGMRGRVSGDGVLQIDEQRAPSSDA